MWGVHDQLERTRRKEKKKGEVVDEKVNCREIVKVYLLDVYQFFQTSEGRYLYPKLDNSWPIIANTRLGKKEKDFVI